MGWSCLGSKVTTNIDSSPSSSRRRSSLQTPESQSSPLSVSSLSPLTTATGSRSPSCSPFAVRPRSGSRSREMMSTAKSLVTSAPPGAPSSRATASPPTSPPTTADNLTTSPSTAHDTPSTSRTKPFRTRTRATEPTCNGNGNDNDNGNGTGRTAASTAYEGIRVRARLEPIINEPIPSHAVPVLGCTDQKRQLGDEGEEFY